MTRAWLALPLVIGSVVGCRPPKHDYPADVLSAFVDRCASQAPRGACECTLDEIQRHFTYEQFTALEQQTKDSGKPPAEFQSAANACR